ncbi:hypothetical protein VTJ83DRAFT_7238 [Remersonia thermophila]|uniref:Thioredoxin-like fold domain-containing protein n=1 Tax=Remersonia thermophila TaxID=72144 RepID=A0ABR4D2X1_9PEZI
MTTASSSTPGWSKVQIPRPLQRLFDLFPLRAYEPNDLPERSQHLTFSSLPTLFIFTTDEDARLGLPSFNPTCLRWQTLLRLTGLEFRVLPSTNHASPTGALPFLLPARSSSTGSSSSSSGALPPSTSPSQPPPPSSSPSPPTPIPASKLLAYAQSHANPAKSSHPATSGDRLFPSRARAYVALVSNHLRSAWLCALYLDPARAGLLDALYLRPASSSAAVRAALRRQLRKAAGEQILDSAPAAGALRSRPGERERERERAEQGKGAPSWDWAWQEDGTAIDPRAVYASAREAMAALASLLAESKTEWFFDAEAPSEFDAAVFSYTHLMMQYMSDGEEEAGALGKMVQSAGDGELARHREKLWRFAWPEGNGEAKEGR